MGLMVLSFEYVVRVKFEPHDSYIKHMQYFKSSRKDTIAFGDSHAAYGIKNENIFNVAFPGERADQSMAKLIQLSKAKKINQVLWQIDNSKLFVLPVPDEQASLEKDFFEDVLLKSMSWYHRPKLYLYLKKFISRTKIESKVKFDNSFGGVISEKEWKTLSLDKVKESAKKEGIKNINIFEENGLIEKNITFYLQNLERTFKSLQANGTKICLIKYPYAKEYLEILSDSPKWQEAGKIWLDFSSKLNLKVINVREIFEKRYDLFNNADHLSPKGAKLFSIEVLRSCNG